MKKWKEKRSKYEKVLGQRYEVYKCISMTASSKIVSKFSISNFSHRGFPRKKNQMEQ